MNYTVKLERNDEIFFNFEDGECEAIDMCEDEPSCISGCISIDDKQIGSINLYELYNDCDFFGKCDALSGDCEVIASAICGKNGKVLKKYLPNGSEYETVLILERISIENEYRGGGIGSNVIKNLLHMIKYQYDSGCAIFLCASDYESANKYGFDSNEYQLGCDRLIAFYKRLGFIVVKDNILVYSEK